MHSTRGTFVNENQLQHSSLLSPISRLVLLHKTKRTDLLELGVFKLTDFRHFYPFFMQRGMEELLIESHEDPALLASVTETSPNVPLYKNFQVRNDFRLPDTVDKRISTYLYLPLSLFISLSLSVSFLLPSSSTPPES